MNSDVTRTCIRYLFIIDISRCRQRRLPDAAPSPMSPLRLMLLIFCCLPPARRFRRHLSPRFIDAAFSPPIATRRCRHAFAKRRPIIDARHLFDITPPSSQRNNIRRSLSSTLVHPLHLHANIILNAMVPTSAITAFTSSNT